MIVLVTVSPVSGNERLLHGIDSSATSHYSATTSAHRNSMVLLMDSGAYRPSTSGRLKST